MSVNAVGPAVVAPERKTGGGGKGIASAFIPGLGQFVDGRTKQGALFLGGTVAAGAANGLLSRSIMKDAFTAVEKGGEAAMSKGGKAKLIGLAALGIAAAGLYIANIVDAYKGDKKAE